MRPKLTVFNGQKAAVRVNDQQFFVTKINTSMVNGQPVYIPVNEPFSLGFQMAVRPTVSADQKFVRCELSTECCELGSPTVPLFPVTTPVTPVFEGGAQGQPIPFTQFIQQPEIVTRGVSKSLMIPDGCTAVLYAGKRTKEEPSEQPGPGAPLFDWINDLVDLVYPPAEVPTYQEHLYVLVTPRVINVEQTEAAAKPMPAGPVQPCPLSCAALGPTPVALDFGMPIVPCSATAPACPVATPCPNATCPNVHVATNPTDEYPPQVQIDACILSVDPAAWGRPVTAAWADLSPNACQNRCTVLGPEAERFCQSMTAQGAAKMLAQPKIVTGSGQTAAVKISGNATGVDVELVECGGTIIPKTNAKLVPYGTSLTVLPVVGAKGLYLECDCEVATAGTVKDYKVTVESAGEEPRTETMRWPSVESRKVKFAVNMDRCGRTYVMHCGRDGEGRDVMLMVTPRMVGEVAQAPCVMPPPVAYAPPPAPGQACPPCVPAPMPPTVWAAPVPARDDIQVVSGQFKPAGESKLDHLLALYYQACQEGDAAEARKLARKCMAIDPTCFGK